MTHIPVLLQEVIAGLAPKSGETILDATVGGGGHSEALCRAVGGNGRIVCLDADRDAIERSRERLTGCTTFFYETNFRHLDVALESFGIKKVERILFDLGFSSFQIEESGRGFSFQRDEPLGMSFAKGSGCLTAAQILNEWEEESIATILESYGEEPRAKRIARAVVTARAQKPLATTKELRELIEGVIPPARTYRFGTGGRRGKIHPATKTFQALRIAVNDEFQALSEALPKAFERLQKGGRMAVISFHSMEDRVVKRFFRQKGEAGEGVVLTKKPQIAREEEQKENPRARSAKLRIIERI